MKRFFFVSILICVLAGCAKEEENPSDPIAKIANEIRTSIAGKVIVTLYLISTDPNLSTIQYDYPYINVSSNFLIINDKQIALDKIKQFSVNPTGTEYCLDIVISP